MSDEARDTAHAALLRGMNQLADAVKVTLGPKGRTVEIKNKVGPPTMTRDGVTVADQVELGDPLESMGMRMVREVGRKTSWEVGGGATTAMVLAWAIYGEAVKRVAGGADPAEIRRGIDLAVKAAVEAIGQMSKPVEGRHIAHVGAISANNDEEIGRIIAEAMEKVGKDGVITVEEAQGLETTLEVVEGLRFDRGYLSPYLVTDSKRLETVLEDVKILLTEKKIGSIRDLLPILAQVAKQGRPLLIIAEDVEGEVLGTLAVNELRVAAVAAPGFGDRRKALLEDIAILTGGQVITEERGIELEDVRWEDLGEAKRVVLSKSETTIVIGLDSPERREAITGRVMQIRSQFEETASHDDRLKLLERLGILTGSVAVIKVGAATESEMKEKKARVEGAMHATMAAIEEGIVPGGGVALLRAIPAVERISSEGDERLGVDIVRRALEEPARLIAANAGEDASIIEQQIGSSSGNIGFNAATGRYEDLIGAGIIDPAKVPRLALLNASSTSDTLLQRDLELGWIGEPIVSSGALDEGVSVAPMVRVRNGATTDRESRGAAPAEAMGGAAAPAEAVRSGRDAEGVGGKPGQGSPSAGGIAGGESQAAAPTGPPGAGGSEGGGGGGGVPPPAGGDDGVPPEKRINVWVSEPDGEPRPPAMLEINFMVGELVPGSLVEGSESRMPLADIPEEGLPTEWVVCSRDVVLAPGSPGTNVKSAFVGDSVLWQATFKLLIPRARNSDVARLGALPLAGKGAKLTVWIYAHEVPYRQLEVELGPALGAHGEPFPPWAASSRTMTFRLPGETGRKPVQPWARPPGTLFVSVGQVATHIKSTGVPTLDGSSWDPDDWISWPPKAQVAASIEVVQSAADAFREQHQDYLNDLPPDDFKHRLEALAADLPGDWGRLGDLADPAHQGRWNTVASAPELFDLAFHGYELYQAVFPSELRPRIEKLSPGVRIEISWVDKIGDSWIAHVPWGLMYQEAPESGRPIDATKFLGLRFRIGYVAYQVENPGGALGRSSSAYAARCLYWGIDEAGQEARWQRDWFGTYPNQVIVPEALSAPAPKAMVRKIFEAPSPRPMTVLYFFCRSTEGTSASDLVLRFAETSALDDTLRRPEMGLKEFADHPFVFANACSTSSADPYIASQLELAFIKHRGCRAFLGTEAKVPIVLASRFAVAFFHLFSRSVSDEPLSAGEAIAQARLFLWTRYRNIGGLLYCLVNKFDIYMADEQEILALPA